MSTLEERVVRTAQNGATDGQSEQSKARSPSRNGKRKKRKKAVGGIGDVISLSDSGRPDAIGSEGKPKHKRARRRSRGKQGQAPEAKPVAATPAATPLADPKAPGKLSNRKRRARNNKRARQQNEQPHVNGAVVAKPAGAERGQQLRHPSGEDASKPRLPFRQEAPLYAALDLGTNNCRLLIASPTRPGQFRVVDAFSRIVRLGEGLSTSGRLSENAMARAIEALKICKDKLASRNISRSRLIATEACRAAANGEEFLQQVRQEAGLELEIVDRQTEARLAVSGCGTLIARNTDAVVLFDIGGGSSEIALIDMSRRRSPRLAEHIVAWTSLPVGVVTLAERFNGRDVTPDSYQAMIDHVTGLLDAFSDRNSLGSLTQSPNFHLLGTSGTVTTLAGIHLGLPRYDRRRVDGMWMSAEEVTQMTDRLLSWDFDTRVANPCIGSDRADLVLAGCAILDAIRNVWPSEKLLVADRGLREGILTELMSRDGAWRHNRGSLARNKH